MYVCPVCQTTYSDGSEPCPADGSPLQPLESTLLEAASHILADRFHLEGVIGVGGMGTVYKALQEPIGRPVAVKILRAELVQDEVFARRFLNEAKAASALQNPNTVTIFDFGRTPDGSLYIAMEYLAGHTLADRVVRGPLPLRHAAEVASQVCRALAEAHRKGIVHRDLKPENIMLTSADDGALLAKVVDFGIAKVQRRQEPPGAKGPTTKKGLVLGTPHYMAPEQAESATPGPAADLYSLGVIVYEMLAGHRPFDHDSPIKLVMQHIQDPVPPLTSNLEPLPPSLVGLVEALLAKSPADRPASAEAVASDLREHLSGPITVREIFEFRPPQLSSVEGIEDAATDPVLPASADEAADSGRDTFPESDNLAVIPTEREIAIDPPQVLTPSLETAAPAASPAAPPEGGAGESPRQAGRLLWAALLAVTIVVLGGAAAGLFSWYTSQQRTDSAAAPAPAATLPQNPPAGPAAPQRTESPDGVTTSLVHLNSSPSGAKVFRGSQLLCTTECSADLPTGQKLLLSFRKDGHLAKSRLVEPGVDARVEVELTSSQPDSARP